MSLIEFDNVSYQYRTLEGRQAVSEIDLSIEEGSFVGITGKADAGKSTLARMIPGYIPNFFEGEFQGTVTVDGIDTRETSVGELSTKAGMLFENPFDQMTGASTTVLEEVAFALENHGYPVEEILDRVRWSLGVVGIEDLYIRNPTQLSGGQSQRVALASILALRPEILILDEPTSQLDPRGTESVFQVIDNLEEDEFTIIIISQDTERLAPHVDRLVVVDEGEIYLDGHPGEVLSTLEDEDDTKVNIPGPIEVGKWLRERELIDATDPVPINYESALSELESIDKFGWENFERDNPNEKSEIPREGDTVPNPQVSFDEVTYRYSDDVEALRDIDIGFDDGCVCIIGQNGAGKTTFVKHLNALLRPSEGDVEVCEKNTRDHRVAKMSESAGLSFQNPNDQLFHDSVEEEVKYGPRNLDQSPEATEAIADEMINLLELSELRERNPYDMGQSLRKRVAVASVLAMETPVVILDEPTGSQDAAGINLLGDIVDILVEEGKLVVVITHDVDFAAKHADRVVALGQGEVLIDDTPEVVFDRPDVLAETDVTLPSVTQFGYDLNLDQTILELDDLLTVLDSRLDGFGE